MQVGTRYDTMPIPFEADHTVFVAGGAVDFGVEYRRLTDDILDAAYAGDEGGAAIMAEARPPSLDDRGVSIHVVDAVTRAEHLRFDCFDEEPHYHYITPSVPTQVLVWFDACAGGDMLDWAIVALRGRLPAMLRAAGADELASRVDPAVVGPALDRVAALGREQRSQQPALPARPA